MAKCCHPDFVRNGTDRSEERLKALKGMSEGIRHSMPFSKTPNCCTREKMMELKGRIIQYASGLRISRRKDLEAPV
jgi:hypothetical protein